MSETFYKAVRPDGTDWWSGAVRWLPEDGNVPEGGWLVEHPDPGPVGGSDAAGYLSVATAPTECTGMVWPTRLLRVEPVGDVWNQRSRKLPHKRAAHAWRVVEERPAHEALGPQGPEEVALLERIRDLTPEEARALEAARDAAWDAAWDAARAAAWDAARNAARDAALGAARNAAWAAVRDAAWAAVREAVREAAWAAVWSVVWGAALPVLVRDLITAEQYGILTGPWRTVMGDPRGEGSER